MRRVHSRRFVLVCLLLVGVCTLVGVVVGDVQQGRAIDVETDRVEVHLQAQQTTIEHDESVIFVYSATNYVTNEKPLTVQLIIEAPSGSDVFSAAGVDEGSGSQFVTTTTLEPGGHESLRIQVALAEPGEYELTGQAIYFFGDDRGTGDGVEAQIPVEQRPPPRSTTERIVDTGATYLSLVPATYQWLSTGLASYATSGGSILFSSYLIYVLGILVFSLCVRLFYWSVSPSLSLGSTGLLGRTSPLDWGCRSSFSGSRCSPWILPV